MNNAEIQPGIITETSTIQAKLKPKSNPPATPDESSLPRWEFESMLTMSRAIFAGQARDYYRQQFTNSKDNYYSESGEVKGRWCGRLASQSWLVSTNDFAVKAAFVFYTK